MNMVYERKMCSGPTDRTGQVLSAFVPRRQGAAYKNSEVVETHIRKEHWGPNCISLYVPIILTSSICFAKSTGPRCAGKQGFVFLPNMEAMVQIW